MTILVTGGNGFIGKNLQAAQPDWVYPSRAECDLSDMTSVMSMFERYKPRIIVHLASSVGGLFYNMANNQDILDQNILVNSNILSACRAFNVTQGIFVLSTCVYPDTLCQSSFGMSENQIHDGLPHTSNMGYAMSKRLLDVQCRLANATGAQFIRLVPGNLYGPHDHFSSDRAHVIPALVHSLKGKTGKVAIHGRPDTLRQFVHASDFCEIISEHVNVLLNGQFDESNSILNIVHKEYTLDEVVRAINPNVVPDWSYKDVGQFKKTCLPNKAISREWTPLERGLKDL